MSGNLKYFFGEKVLPSNLRILLKTNIIFRLKYNQTKVNKILIKEEILIFLIQKHKIDFLKEILFKTIEM